MVAEDMRATFPRAARGAFSALATVAALNLLFLAAAFCAASTSPATAVQAVRKAFATGELADRDYLKTDWHRGKNPYNDCVVLQLIINPRESLAQKALAPIFYVSDGANPDVCRSLRRLASGGDPASMFGDSYSRYWHGYVPLTQVMLAFTDVETARQALRLLTIAALLLLGAVAARAGGATRIAGLSVCVTGLLFWGLPFYGQGLSFAPGDALVVSGIAAAILLRRQLQDVSRLVIFCAAYGSLVAYLDFLTGPLPTGACLLFLFTWLARFDRSRTAPRSSWREAFLAVAAYASGAILTVAIKQLIVLALFGPGELRSFVQNAELYTGLSNIQALPAAYFKAFFNLFEYTPLLTYYSIPAGAALLFCSAAAWAAAAYLAYRSPAHTAKALFVAHAVAAAGIAGWVLLLPVHTLHGFMSRMLMVPFALGWSVLALQWSAASGSAARSGGTKLRRASTENSSAGE